MTQNDIKERIKNDEYDGEKIINYFRLALAFIYAAGMPVISTIRNMEGYGPIPLRAHICTAIFFMYSLFLFFYLQKKKTLQAVFKYFCVTFDMTIISASIWVSCTYLEICPPVSFLSILAMFYLLLILTGCFRYSPLCAIFSGIYAGICYSIVIIVNSNTIDLPYRLMIESGTIDVRFPLYNETFRVMSMIVAGAIASMASKRHLALMSSIIEAESFATKAASRTVEQTRDMAETIRKSTDEIFLSSKDIFSTANNQAASIQEIESTINENTQIAVEIAAKTSSVAAIASKMENDVNHGFSVLERNVSQLEDIKHKNDGIISGIIALGNKIAKIRDIIKTINTITDQTKVIAFNAALEAASAGEKGKRFAVVASEVNRLADDIASLTKQIRDQAEEIQSSSSSLIISSEESADKITEGNNLIKELEDIFSEVRSGAEITANQAQTITVSTQKQQKSTEQINIAITDISKGLSNFLQSTRVATSSAEDLSQLIEKLGALLTVNVQGETKV
jgi:methyl-accepting chemotaxis protein